MCSFVALRSCCVPCGYQSCDITDDLVFSDCDVYCLGNRVTIEFVSNFTLHKWTCAQVSCSATFSRGSPEWLATLRPVTGAKSDEIHVDMLLTVLCGDLLVRVVDTVL